MYNGKVLILESQNRNSDSMSKILADGGFATTSVEGLDMVYELAAIEKPDVILMDLDSYSLEVWDLCKRLKEDYDIQKSALIILSTDNKQENVVRAFESGADNFISKPVGKKEIAARLKAIIRRMNRTETKKIKVKDIEIDLSEHTVKKGGKPIDLTYIQFKLLYLLASRRDNVFSRKDILEKVWGQNGDVTNRTVDVQIKRLREKLGEDKYPSKYIETIHGTGYRFV